MRVLITDSGELAELTYNDPDSGADLILNYFEQSGQLAKFFFYCERQERYLCSQQTFEWCSDLLKDFLMANGDGNG